MTFNDLSNAKYDGPSPKILYLNVTSYNRKHVESKLSVIEIVPFHLRHKASQASFRILNLLLMGDQASWFEQSRFNIAESLQFLTRGLDM